MFKISEIKKWAKDHGYTVIKEKDDTINGASYYWSKNDDPQSSGVELSVSKVAKAIYNHLSNDQWIEYQKKYIEDHQEIKTFTVSDYGT